MPYISLKDKDPNGLTRMVRRSVLGGKTRVSEEDKADKVSAIQTSSGQETESTSNPGTLLRVTLRAWQPFPSLPPSYIPGS